MARIAFISTMEGVAWGGSEELWSQAALNLLNRGHDVLANIKAWPDESSTIKQLEAAGCKTTRRKEPGVAARIKARVWPTNKLEWLQSIRPDLVVISQGTHVHGIDWALASLESKIPYVLVAQAAAEQWWPNDAESIRVLQAYQSAAVSFFVSNGNLNLLETQVAADLPNAKIARNPFNVDYDACPDWPLEQQPLRLACVGRLDPAAKGQDLLIQVLSRETWRLRPIQISLAGSGPNKNSLMRLIDQKQLHNVTFIGFVSDIEQLWHNHHGLILPSRYEGLPLAVVEAMLCGRLCIVTDVAGNKELIEDNVSGFVAAAPTVDALDEAMERAWQRRAEWKQIGQAAATQVRTLVPRDPIGTFADELLQLIPS